MEKRRLYAVPDKICGMTENLIDRGLSNAEPPTNFSGGAGAERGVVSRSPLARLTPFTSL